MIRKCYQLTFTSPLHLSSGGFALEGIDTFLRSDTLFSALCATAAAFWDDEARLKDFFFPGESNTPPRFCLSSGFPYFQDIFFLPKPFFYAPSNDLSHTDKKRLHKVRFVDSLLWRDMITGKSNDIPFFPDHRDVCHPKDNASAPQSAIVNGCWTNQRLTIQDENLHAEEKWIKEKAITEAKASGKRPKLPKATRFFEEIERPRVTIDRISSDATIFHFGEIVFRRGAGLYFLADFEQDKDVQTFEALLTMLGEQGLGADRTVGRGMFEYKSVAPPIAAMPVASAAPTDTFISLSLFVPADDELSDLDFSASWYDFTLRRGWVSQRELRRRSFRMFTEGSAFKIKTPAVPQGKLLKALDKDNDKLNLDHDVWRSGLCFAVPAILPDNL